MTRRRYLVLFFILIILVIFGFDSGSALVGEWTPALQLTIGLGAWVLVWFRYDFLQFRKEFALLAALPLILAPVNELLFLRGGGSGMPFFHYLMILAWLAAGVVMVAGVLPDKKIPNERRLDTISIVIIVFIGYFILSFVVQQIGQIINRV